MGVVHTMRKKNKMAEEEKYNSDDNKLGWVVGGIGFIYLFVFIYYSFSGNIQAQIISGASFITIFIIDMLIFALTEYKTGGIK